MSNRSVVFKSWMIVRLIAVLFGLLITAPSNQFNFAGSALAASDLCPAVQNACGCATCGCGSTVSEPSCPAGQVLFDDYCLPACPSGFNRYPGMPGLCMPPCHHGCPVGYEQIPLPECPQGFHRDLRDPNICLQDRGQISAEGECPIGMAYAPETGRCEVDCPSGTFRNEGGLCESYYTRECPKGYGRDPESGKCLPPGTWPVGYNWLCMPQCPVGTYRDINQPTRCIPPKVDCPQGSENVQGRCLPVCEQGTKRDSYGYCYPPVQCPPGSYANLRGLCEQPQCPQGSEIVRGQCAPLCDEGTSRNENGRCTPPDGECQQGEELVRGQCVPLCDEGLIRDDNGRCTPPRSGCAQGEEHYRDQCVPLCKQGTYRDDNGRCIPPKKTCPKNTTYNAKRNKCEPIRIEQPKCDQGEIRDRNGRCVPVRKDPNCPQGTRLNDNGRCEPIVRLVPRGCPDGFYLERKRNKCIRIPQDEQPERIDRIERIPGIELVPGIIERLIPRGKQQETPEVTPRRVPQEQPEADCPQGTFRDNNGRCVGKIAN